MPSPIAHTVTGYVVYKFFPSGNSICSDYRKRIALLTYCVFIANLPDLDFIPQLVTGEKYHHGFSHSLLFAFSFSLISGACLSRYLTGFMKSTILLAFILYSSHIFMDYFTGGGRGILFLWPFSERFFISPVSLFPGTHYSKEFLHSSHLKFMGFELMYLTFALLGVWMWEKGRYGILKRK